MATNCVNEIYDIANRNYQLLSLSVSPLCILIKPRCSRCSFYYLNWMQLELPWVAAHTCDDGCNRKKRKNATLLHINIVISLRFFVIFHGRHSLHCISGVGRPISLANIITTQRMSCFTSYWRFHLPSGAEKALMTWLIKLSSANFDGRLDSLLRQVSPQRRSR